MMFWSLFLLALALVLIILDVYIGWVDYGILTALGIASLIVSVYITIVHVPLGMVFLGVQAAIFVPTFAIFFRYLRKKQMVGKLILNESLDEAPKTVEDLSTLLGKEGKTITALRPSGNVSFNGLKLEVFADKYIEANKRVKVDSVADGKVFVKLAMEN